MYGLLLLQKQNFDSNFLIEFKSKNLNIKDTKNEDNLDQILKPSLNWILGEIKI